MAVLVRTSEDASEIAEGAVRGGGRGERDEKK